MTDPPSSLAGAHRFQLPRRYREVICCLALLVCVRPAAKALDFDQDHAELRLLADGQQIERELLSGVAQAFVVTLPADQHVQLLIDQHGVNLTMAVVGTSGEKLADVDNAKSTGGSERLTFITEAPGDHRIVVRAVEKNAPTGRYRITVSALGVPTAQQRDLESARRLSHQSRTLRTLGKYDEALPLEERALALRENGLGANDLLVGESLHNLALLHDNKGDYAKAEPINLRALSIRETTLGPEHPDVAKTLNNLAWIHNVRHDYAQSEAFYLRALAIQEKAFGGDHPEVATTLNDLALLFSSQGAYERAIELNLRVLSIRERALGPDDAGVAKALSNVALIYDKKGEYAKAESLCLRALSIWEKALGRDHPEVAFAVDNLGRIYYFQGDYARAEPLWQRALSIREKTLGPDHQSTATSLNNLAALYLRKGDLARAEPLAARSLASWEKRFGRDHAAVAFPLTNLAKLYENAGDDARAAVLYQRALVVREQSLDPGHSEIGEALNNLGQLILRSKKDDNRAESLLQRSQAIIEKALGSEHPTVAAPVSHLAALYERRGERALAERSYQRALAIRENALGPDHPDVARSLDSLATLHRRNGDAAQALAFMSRSSEVRERHLSHNLPLGSERQKVSYVELFSQDTDSAVSFHAQSAPHDHHALHLALTTLLRRKGRALDAMTDSVAALYGRSNDEDRGIIRQLSDERSRLAVLTLKGPDPTNPAVHRSQLDERAREVDRLEAVVSARSAEFRAQSQPITITAVQSAVPTGTALIEFARYRPASSTVETRNAPRYAAYVLLADGAAQWVDLGDAAALDQTIESWRLALRDPDRIDARRLARAADAALMQPVRTLLGRSRHLLISPDGALNLIPFAALVDEQDRYLVERFTITYLTSGRDLLRLQVPRTSKSGPVIVADPAFGEPAIAAGSGERVDDSQIFFGPLPGVRDELRALRKLLPQAAFLTEDEATEHALKQVNGPSLLHIATHGFFLSDRPGAGDPSTRRPEVAAGRDKTRLGRFAADIENPLLRSGLALAGANRGSHGGDDGLLTALEAAGLDLWGTKLVVLAACDTGVGEVRNGDGVYGLRRALVLAGAESQMISLWPVSDRSTRDLMVGYYQLLIDAQGRGEALRQVQLQMLRSKRHAHPYYWASFILSGQWASLGDMP